jgi:hypothetical protein
MTTVTRFAIETNDNKTFYVYTKTIKAAREMAALYFRTSTYLIRAADSRDDAHYDERNKI